MDDNLYRYINDVKTHIKRPEVKESQWAQHYLDITDQHFRGINNAEGIFEDTMVAGKEWCGQVH